MTDQPEALRVAQVLESDWRVNLVIAVAPAAARLLREQHAEIEELREEVRKWQQSFGGHLYVKTEDYAELVGERDAFKAENEALRRDAKCYQRLKSRAEIYDGHVCFGDVRLPAPIPDRSPFDEIDEAVLAGALQDDCAAAIRARGET